METAVILSGRVTAEGSVELDERVPLPPGPVRVTVQSLPGRTVGSSFEWPSEQELRWRKEALVKLPGCVSNEEAAEMLKVIEDEFEQVDPDEWR